MAIAAFLQQAQSRKLEVAVYIQKGVKPEGVRDQLLLNAVTFETENVVLADFIARIRSGTFKPTRLPPPKEVTVRLRWRVLNQSGEHHQYELVILVTNTGSEALTSYWVDVLFPSAALDTYHGALLVDQQQHHSLIRVTREMVGTDLYPGDQREVMFIGYHMDDDLFHDGTVLRQSVIIRCGSTGMTTQEMTESFADLQKF